MDTILFTGFPGFLGVQLLPRVLARSPGSRALCLVQPKFAALARRRVEEIEAADPALSGRIELVEGDITRPGLGLDDPTATARSLHQVWHLAAVYDLSVPRDLGMRVNVDGTRHVLDLCEAAPDLDRLQYVSTCYVSGRHAGIFRETDLDVGQRFNNFYEETKFLAEVEVRDRQAGGLPSSVYRPAIVVGDSTTGETQKYDGPYFALQWLLRQPRVALMPVVGDPTAVRLNVVPRDFVVEAITRLSGEAASRGRVYQLADPRAITVDELLRAMATATGRRMLRVPLPRRLATAVLRRVGPVERLLRIPASAVDYFAHPTFYDTTQASTDLAAVGLDCPELRGYLPVLVDYMRRHPEVGHDAMV